jgi:hypothetical protein
MNFFFVITYYYPYLFSSKEAILGYFIIGYYRLFYHSLFLAILDYLTYVISGYFILGYYWLT